MDKQIVLYKPNLIDQLEQKTIKKNQTPPPEISWSTQKLFKSKLPVITLSFIIGYLDLQVAGNRKH